MIKMIVKKVSNIGIVKQMYYQMLCLVIFYFYYINTKS